MTPQEFVENEPKWFVESYLNDPLTHRLVEEACVRCWTDAEFFRELARIYLTRLNNQKLSILQILAN